MRLLARTACCLTAAMTGCGGAAAPRAAVTPAPTASPDPALGALCDLPKIRPDADQAAVPPELRLPGSQIASSRQTGSAVSATILFPLSLTKAYQDLLAAGPRAGYEILFNEFEGFEAEVYLRSDAGIAKFRLRPSRCPDASQALFQRVTLDS
jgi:hypothetical protein